MAYNGSLEPFTGTNQNVVQWLRKFQKEITRGRPADYVPSPTECLEEVDTCLKGEAERGADNNPLVRHLLSEDHTP
jgi:hypothetical protein